MYHTKDDYDIAKRVNDVLNKGTLERYSVSPEEMKSIEPSLTGEYFAAITHQAMQPVISINIQPL